MWLDDAIAIGVWRQIAMTEDLQLAEAGTHLANDADQRLPLRVRVGIGAHDAHADRIGIVSGGMRAHLIRQSAGTQGAVNFDDEVIADCAQLRFERQTRRFLPLETAIAVPAVDIANSECPAVDAGGAMDDESLDRSHGAQHCARASTDQGVKCFAYATSLIPHLLFESNSSVRKKLRPARIILCEPAAKKNAAATRVYRISGSSRNVATIVVIVEKKKSVADQKRSR